MQVVLHAEGRVVLVADPAELRPLVVVGIALGERDEHGVKPMGKVALSQSDAIAFLTRPTGEFADRIRREVQAIVATFEAQEALRLRMTRRAT